MSFTLDRAREYVTKLSVLAAEIMLSTGWSVPSRNYRRQYGQVGPCCFISGSKIPGEKITARARKT